MQPCMLSLCACVHACCVVACRLCVHASMRACARTCVRALRVCVLMCVCLCTHASPAVFTLFINIYCFLQALSPTAVCTARRAAVLPLVVSLAWPYALPLACPTRVAALLVSLLPTLLLATPSMLIAATACHRPTRAHQSQAAKLQVLRASSFQYLAASEYCATARVQAHVCTQIARNGNRCRCMLWSDPA